MWTVKPYVANRFIFSINGGSENVTMLDPHIIVVLVSARPLTSTLTITSNFSFERANVTCVSTGGTETLEFNSGGKNS